MGQMAAGLQLRKIVRWSVLLIAMAGLTALLFRDTLSLTYHKRRLVTAKARHWRLTTQGYSFWDHVTEIVRGRPVAAEESVTVWKAHEEALVRRGFLQRQVFVSKKGALPSRSTHPDYNAVLARMEASCPWWAISRVETNLVVTSCARGLAEWGQLAPKLDLVLKEERSQSAEEPKARCWRKRKKSRQVETLTASRSSVYRIDDVRAFMEHRAANRMEP